MINLKEWEKNRNEVSERNRNGWVLYVHYRRIC